MVGSVLSCSLFHCPSDALSKLPCFTAQPIELVNQLFHIRGGQRHMNMTSRFDPAGDDQFCWGPRRDRGGSESEATSNDETRHVVSQIAQ
jgi:hypothetical protein